MNYIDTVIQAGTGEHALPCNKLDNAGNIEAWMVDVQGLHVQMSPSYAHEYMQYMVSYLQVCLHALAVTMKTEKFSI